MSSSAFLTDLGPYDSGSFNKMTAKDKVLNQNRTSRHHDKIKRNLSKWDSREDSESGKNNGKAYLKLEKISQKALMVVSLLL